MYQNADIRVLANPHLISGKSSGDWACISFSPHGPAGIGPTPYGGSFFAKYGIPALHVVPRRNDWYQSASMPAALEAAKQATSGHRIVAYGASMGGFGVLAWAAELGARRVIVISPQVSVSDRVVGHFENRWREDAAAIKHYIREDARCATLDGIDGLVIYDPRHARDARHVNMLRDAFPKLRVLALPYSYHMAGRAASAAGFLSELLCSLCSDADFDQAVGRARERYRNSAIRQKRVAVALWIHARKHPHHWALAERLRQRYGHLEDIQGSRLGPAARRTGQCRCPEQIAEHIADKAPSWQFADLMRVKAVRFSNQTVRTLAHCPRPRA